MVYLIIVLVIFVVFLQIQYNLFTLPQKGLTVLMYHKVSENSSDGLTITKENLKKQFGYIRDNGYTLISCNDLLSKDISKIEKPLLLTFDDGYVNNAELLFPLLKEFGFRATIFLPVKYIGGVNEWDGGNEKIMNYPMLKSADPAIIEFGLHSHQHINYRHTHIDKIEEDIQMALATLTLNDVRFVPAIAYPYGGFPREKKFYSEFTEVLSNQGIKLGFRIGNRINKLPMKDAFTIHRIDVKGSDSFWTFTTKLRKGRVKMF